MEQDQSTHPTLYCFFSFIKGILPLLNTMWLHHCIYGLEPSRNQRIECLFALLFSRDKSSSYRQVLAPCQTIGRRTRDANPNAAISCLFFVARQPHPLKGMHGPRSLDQWGRGLRLID